MTALRQRLPFTNNGPRAAEGLPASVLGIVACQWLQDSPAQAHWLSAGEKQRLAHHLTHDVKVVEGASHSGMGALLRDP